MQRKLLLAAALTGLGIAMFARGGEGVQQRAALDPGYGTIRVLSAPEDPPFGDYVFEIEGKYPVPMLFEFRIEGPEAGTGHSAFTLRTDLDHLADDVDWALGLEEPSILYEDSFPPPPVEEPGGQEVQPPEFPSAGLGGGFYEIRSTEMPAWSGSQELKISLATERNDLILTWQSGAGMGSTAKRIPLEGDTVKLVKTVEDQVTLTGGKTVLWQAEILKQDQVRLTVTYAITVREVAVVLGAAPGERTVWTPEVSAYARHIGALFVRPMAPDDEMPTGVFRAFDAVLITNRGGHTITRLEGIVRRVTGESVRSVRLAEALAPGGQIRTTVINGQDVPEAPFGPYGPDVRFLELRKLELAPAPPPPAAREKAAGEAGRAP